MRTAGFTYWRFHGPNAFVEPYQHRYGAQRLRPAVERLEAWSEEGCDVYAYFNNDWHGNAVADASWMCDRLEIVETGAGFDQSRWGYPRREGGGRP